MKAIVAGYSTIDTILWYHEELNCEEVNKIIQKRLAAGEEPTFSYGKVMERLLYCKQKSKQQFLEVSDPSRHSIL